MMTVHCILTNYYHLKKTNHWLFIHKCHFQIKQGLQSLGKAGRKGNFEKSQEKPWKIRQIQGYFLLVCRNLYFAVLMISLVLLRYLEKTKYKICVQIFNMCRTDNEYNF